MVLAISKSITHMPFMSIYTFPAFHPALQSHIFQSHAIYNYRHYFDDANIDMSKDNQAFELYMLIHE